MESETLSMCCGVIEFGYFNEEQEEYPYDEIPASKEQQKEIFEEIRGIMERHPAGYYYTAWFKRPKNFDGSFARQYENATLAALISRLPGVKKLPPTINPNSGNMIKGYIWKKS